MYAAINICLQFETIAIFRIDITLYKVSSFHSTASSSLAANVGDSGEIHARTLRIASREDELRTWT